MKTQILKITSILFMALAVVSCKEKKNETEATQAEEVETVAIEATTYTVEADSSSVAWKGFKPTSSHHGTINLTEGTISVANDTVVGGEFVIDMKSIKNIDLEDPEWNGKLIGHLASADFFDSENHPTSSFAITGIEEKDGKTFVKGNLTIKEIVKNIEFPAVITVGEEEVTLVSEPFTIDRTDWDIKYNSGKFFENLQDKLIKDEIELAVNVTASK